MPACKNCQFEFVGQFCPECGQRVIDRFSVHSIRQWIADEFFVFDRGILFTIKELLLRPVWTIERYISGITTRYTNPYKLLLVLLSLFAFVTSFLPDEELGMGFKQMLAEWPAVWSGESFGYFLKNWPSLLIVNVLFYFGFTQPLWSFFSWLFFRKRGLNFVEHFIVWTYLSCTILVWTFGVASIMVLLILLFPSEEATYIAVAVGVLVPVQVLFLTKRIFREAWLVTTLKDFAVGYLGVIITMCLQFLLITVIKILFDAWN